jgi:hypothetical protein
MNRIGAALLWLFFSLSVVYGQAFKIKITSTLPLKVLPGEIGTVIMKISNEDTVSIKLTPSFVKNESLTCIMCNGILSVPAKSIKTIIVPFMVSKNSQPGLQKVIYKLVATDSTYAEEEISFEIRKKVDFTVSMINMPEFIGAGEPIKATAIIQNNGNVSGEFKIKKLGFTDKLTNTIVLKPAEKMEYNLYILTDKNLTRPDFITYGLKIISVDDTLKVRDISHSTYIFPVAEVKKSPYFSIPGRVKMNYFFNNSNNTKASGYQYDIFFKGSLDQSNLQRVELLMRGPNRFSNSTLGTYDEYYINYKNKHYEGHLGDKIFSLTPLIEMSRFGRGIQFVHNYDSNISYGVYYAVPRFNSTIKREYAAFGSYLLKNKIQLGMNMLYKQNSGLADNAFLTSFTAGYSKSNKYSIDGELAQSFIMNRTSVGFRSTGMYKRRKLNLSYSTIIAGRNFAGYYKNTTIFVINSTYNIDRTTDFNFNFNKDFQNPTLDSIVFIAPTSTSYFVGFTKRLNTNFSLRLLYRSTAFKDRSALQSFNYKSDFIQLALNQKIKSFTYNFVGDYGLNKNFKFSEDSSKSTFTNIYLEIQYNYSKVFFVSIFQNFANTNRYSYLNENSIFYGGSLSFRMGNSFGASLRYQSNYFPEEYYRNRDAIDLRLRYSNSNRLEFSLATRYVFLAQKANKKELYLQLSSSYKINLPIKKIASYGKVTGKINSKTGKSAKDILVHLNGSSAVTKRDGSFTFSNVPSGNYYLYVDQTSLLLNEIIEQLTPVKVEVFEGKTNVVNLDIIQGAKITGKVKVNFKKGAYYDDTTVTIVPSVVLVLKSEFESQTIVSDKDGMFYFKNLKPGKWKLTVYDNMLENKYILEKEQFIIDLISGQNLEIEIKIRKKEKKIKFQQPKK